ncbi:hypothetical protein [Chryseobacterium camelliae]|uniref:hypothetical protein n=1 Tax=Chryseobacterium camelliae TaxID=1265445 RepID=UPI00285A74B2|nr:hypothetical protein [Chryseobacterium camelliae]MDR6516663.1 hypothetical protein [Chryseobacterium camelliae]
MRKTKLLFFVAILFATIINLRCTQEEFVLQNAPRETLSKNARDYSERLEAIRKKFYEQKLDEKFKSKIKQDVIWTPDWDHPRLEVVNDSVSYVFYQLVAKLNVNGKQEIAKQINGTLQLMVKNEVDFYQAFYYDPKVDPNVKIDQDTKEFNLKAFTGNLLLSSLQNGKNYLIEYVNGHLSNSYLKKGTLAIQKRQSLKGTNSYWVENCNRVVRNCTFSSLSPSWCGGSVNIVFSPDCHWPQSTCGDTYSLVDSDEVVVCENIWFPDPPQEPSDPGNGGGNGGNDPDPGTLTEEQITDAVVYNDGKPKIADIKKYTKCFNDGKQAQTYTMTIFVDQPVTGQGDWFKIVTPGVATNNPFGVPTGIVWTTPDGTFFDVGHTFVTFEKNNFDGTNVRQTLGFYPSSNPLVSHGAMENNSNHQADVSYTINVTEGQFNAALAKVEDDFESKMYILTNIDGNEYNCTDAAISWMNAAGANFQNSSTGLFRNTPGSFGEVLRAKSGANTSPGSGIQGKGECN